MGLDIFFYATEENIAKDALEPTTYDKNAWNKAYEDGKVMRVGDSLRKNYPLHSYVCSSFVEDGGDSDLNCEPYPINHLIESILSLAKNREFDAFDMDADEMEFGETYNKPSYIPKPIHAKNMNYFLVFVCFGLICVIF